MGLRRVGHVNLSVDDIERGKDFYGRILGLAPAPRPLEIGRRGFWFVLGEVEVHLSEDRGSENRGSMRHVAFEVDDIPALRARLEAEGVAIEEARPLPGLIRFFARDPAGNRLEFFSAA